MILSQPIRCLTLTMAAGCNLQCEYCLLHQSRNNNSINIQNNIIQALSDGTYLNNTLLVLNKLSSSPNQINYLEFWGQEPTLTLNYLTDNLQDWFAAFPNIKKITFSTNGIAHSDKIISFIQKVEQIVTHQIHIHIQFSYDDEYSNNNFRHADSNLITNNIKKIILAINEINLSKVRVHFNFHAVISNKLVNDLSNLNEINNYCENLFEWPKQFIDLNKNLNLRINNYIDFGIEAPIDASQEDGIKFANFCKLIRRCDYNLSHNNIVSKILKRFFIDSTEEHFQDFISLDDHTSILNILKQSNNDLDQELSLRKGFCGTNYQDLKIMYDGTLLGCQNQIFDTNINFINTNDKFLYSIKKDQVIHNRILNPINASEEDLQLLFYTHDILRKYNFKILYNNILNLMYILAKCNQIDNNYLYNENELLIFAFYIAKYNNCFYNALIKTGNSFFKNCGIIRFLCNGALQEIILGD